MKRSLIILGFLLSVFLMNSQEVIKPTDALKNKVVLVMPDITSNQLEELKVAFQDVSQVKNAVYVFKNHNCLLLDIELDNNFKFYTDILKIIIGNSTYDSKNIAIKTPDAYSEIMGKGKKEDSTDVLIK